jgi:hypothetical protein
MALEVRAGGRIVASRRFDRRIEWRVSVPASVIREARGALTLNSDASFIPSRTQRNGDTRELSLRVLGIDVTFGEGAGESGGTKPPSFD